MPRAAATSSCPRPANWRSSITLAATVSSAHQAGEGVVEGDQLLVLVGGGLVRDVDAVEPSAPFEAVPCDGPLRPGCAAHGFGHQRRRSGPGRPTADPAGRRPIGGRPRGPGPWPGASGRASRARAAVRRAFGVRRRPEARRPARTPAGRRASMFARTRVTSLIGGFRRGPSLP